MTKERTLDKPWKGGLYIVVHPVGDGQSIDYICAPPGWYFKLAGGYGYDGSAGPEHSPDRSRAYQFSLRNAQVVAANCCGKVVSTRRVRGWHDQ